MSSTERQCHMYDFLMEAVFMGILCLLGFGGNTLSMICLSKDRSKTATPFLLVSLEAADTFFLVTVLILRVLTSINPYKGTPEDILVITPYLVKIVFPLALVAMTATIYLTILVTVNRYISVCQPYRVTDLCSVQHAHKHVIIVTTFCVFYNLPRFFETDLITSRDPVTNATYTEAIISNLAKNKIYQILYGNVLYFLVMFLIPLTTLIILNYKLINVLRETKQKRAAMQSVDHGSRSEEDITLTLIVVVLVFIITQTPALITQLLQNFLPRSLRLCPSIFFYYERISDLFVVFNSSINFLIYCFCSRRFRQILVVFLCKSSRLAREASFMNRNSYRVVANSMKRTSRSSSSNRTTSVKSHKKSSIQGTLL